MTWDPAVLRRYNTTGHFRLLNQVRSELRGNPLIRPKDGETVGAANRSRSLTRALENRAQAGYGRTRSRSAAAAVDVVLASPEQRREALLENLDGFDLPGDQDGVDGSTASFRERLNAIDMR
jgi:hypothetical protein